MHTSKHSCTHARTHTLTHTRACVHARARGRTHAHTHAHARTHVRTPRTQQPPHTQHTHNIHTYARTPSLLSRTHLSSTRRTVFFQTSAGITTARRAQSKRDRLRTRSRQMRSCLCHSHDVPRRMQTHVCDTSEATTRQHRQHCCSRTDQRHSHPARQRLEVRTRADSLRRNRPLRAQNLLEVRTLEKTTRRTKIVSPALIACN